MSSQLLDAAALAAQLKSPDLRVIDCRNYLSDTEKGRRAYRESRIPGAGYAHLDEDLSGPKIKGATGRHPLPEPADAARAFARLGIGNDSQVVVYDDASGAIAARLWWMLRWLGHDAVRVLDGGWQAWLAGGFPLEHHEPQTRMPATFNARLREGLWLTSSEINGWRQDPSRLVLDARSPERYRGEVEPIDPVAGHVPGALSCPFSQNLGTDGRFLPPDQLERLYRDLLNGRPSESVAVYCGSGVTAAHNLLAMEIAGLSGGKLYAGSWSEWITDPNRPVAVGKSDPPHIPTDF